MEIRKQQWRKVKKWKLKKRVWELIMVKKLNANENLSHPSVWELKWKKTETMYKKLIIEKKILQKKNKSFPSVWELKVKKTYKKLIIEKMEKTKASNPSGS